MLYEVINPSDKVIFETTNDKVACFCVWAISSTYGVQNEEGKSFGIPAFHGGQELYDKMFGKDLDKFIIENKDEIIKCFKTFYYGNFESYKDFKNCLEAITDEDKKKEFLKKHENNARTSMDTIVLNAWKLSEALISNTK